MDFADSLIPLSPKVPVYKVWTGFNGLLCKYCVVWSVVTRVWYCLETNTHYHLWIWDINLYYTHNITPDNKLTLSMKNVMTFKIVLKWLISDEAIFSTNQKLLDRFSLFFYTYIIKYVLFIAAIKNNIHDQISA